MSPRRIQTGAAALLAALCLGCRPDASPPAVVFLPVVGNHDITAGQGENAAYIRGPMLAELAGLGAARYDDVGANYVFDWRNARFIVVDQYAWGDLRGRIDARGLAWVESAIRSAGTAEHVFVVFHEPAFPRVRHVGDSFDFFREDRDAFWAMLVRHRGKVRAVLSGHTHYLGLLQIGDPSRPRNDLPHEDGIHQVDCGSTHRRDRVVFRVAGPAVFCHAITNGVVAGTWAVNSEREAPDGAWAFGAVSDPQWGTPKFREMLERTRDNRDPEIPGLPRVELVLCPGDLVPAADHHAVFREVFGTGPGEPGGATAKEKP